jgi:thiol:disulfide interchange protein DsbD
MQVRYHSGTPVFVQVFQPTTPGLHVVKGEVEFMVCNDKTCLPPEVVAFSIDLPDTGTKP